MRRSRLIWSFGLALSLSGCAGNSLNLVARPTDGSRPSSRLLAWRDRQAPRSAPESKPTTTTPPTSDEESPTGSMAATSPARASGEPATPTSRFLGRSAWTFPGLGRWTAGNQAKAELVQPAGNDVWADWARMNAQAKAQGQRNRQRSVEPAAETVIAERREAVTEGEDAILPVALQVGTHAPIGRPRLESPPSLPRPRAGAPDESDSETLPATLPDAVETDQGDGVKRTSLEDIASPLTDQPPAPDQPAQAPSPRTAPPPRTKPSTAPESAPEAETKPAAAPEPNVPAAANPAPAPAAEPAAAAATVTEPVVLPTPTAPAAEPPASTEPTPAPPAQQVVASSPQIAATAPAAPGKAEPLAAPAAAKKTLPSAAAPAILAPPTKTLPAAAAPSGQTEVPPAGVSPSPQRHVPSHKKPSLLAKIHHWKMAKLKPAVFAAPAPPKTSTPAPAPASQVSPQAQAMPGYTYAGGYLSSTPLYPAAYYSHPAAAAGADAAQRLSPLTTPVGPTDINVATASATVTASAPVTKPGQWSAAVPKAAPVVKGPRISLFSRFTSWARGDEVEVDRHPLNCYCGDHPRAVPGAPVSSLPVSPLIPAESGNLSKAGESVKRVAADRLDEASQR